MKKLMFPRFAFVSLVILIILSGCKSQPPTPAPKMPIRMGAVRAAYYLPLFVVQEKELLKKRGYESQLELFNTNPAMIDSFLAGKLEIAAQSSGTMFPLELQHPNQFRFIYGQNNKSYSFIVLKTSKIRTLADLRGKKIATWPSPTAKVFVELCLKRFFDPKEATIIPKDFALLNQVLYQHDVDAVFNTDVFTAQALHSGKAKILEEFPMTKYILSPLFNGGGFVREQFAESQPDATSAVVQAFNEAIEYIATHPEEARLLMTKYVSADRSDLLAAQLDDYVQVTQINIPKAQELADILASSGLMNRDIQV